MLLQQTAQDISFAATIERNEVYERQLFRQQKMKEAADLDYIIQMRADEERRRLEEDHMKALVSAPLEKFESLAQKYAPLKMEVPSPGMAATALRQHHVELSVPKIPTTVPNFANNTDSMQELEAQLPRQVQDGVHKFRASGQDDTMPIEEMSFGYVPVGPASMQPAGALPPPPQAAVLVHRAAPPLLSQVDHEFHPIPPSNQASPALPPMILETTMPLVPTEEVIYGPAPAQSAPHLSGPSPRVDVSSHLMQEPADRILLPAPTQTIQSPGRAPASSLQMEEASNVISKEGESRGEEMTDRILADYYHMTRPASSTEVPFIEQGATSSGANEPLPAIKEAACDDVRTATIAPAQPSPLDRQPDITQAHPSPPKAQSALESTQGLPTATAEVITPSEISPEGTTTSACGVPSAHAAETDDPVPASGPSLSSSLCDNPSKEVSTSPTLRNPSAPDSPTDVEATNYAPRLSQDDTTPHNEPATEAMESVTLQDSPTTATATSVVTLANESTEDKERVSAIVDMTLSVDESFDLSHSAASATVEESTNATIVAASATDQSMGTSMFLPSPEMSADVLVLDGSNASMCPDTPIPRMTSAFSTKHDIDESTHIMAEDADDRDECTGTSVTFNLTINERLSVLQALIPRIEDATKDGEQFTADVESGIEMKSKQDLLKMAMGGRKAQIGFFGGDVCFALLLDVCRDAAPYLFPERIFEGKMTDQKLVKEYKSCRERELDFWKLLSAHFKHLVAQGAMPGDQLVELLVGIFLAHLNNDARSTRKLKEFLSGHLGSGATSEKPPAPPSKQSVDAAKPVEPAPKQPGSKDPKLYEAKSVLDLAFMQSETSPSKRKASEKGLKLPKSSMSASSGGLGQRVLRGVNLGDISEFEDDDDSIDLNKFVRTPSNNSRASGKPAATTAKAYSTTNETKRAPKDDDFDADF
ncbi:hypothetical protein, variant [Aphanomyces invadans]|nr:hypothetical protein, variant [Aphanomyces invadans]ETV97733.1 hypothetical protein, variant [Aphanomyces invadans]|eukprot:XP_008873294.1 hypothetical protein, variant [Aphanomyces invadans]